jgi:hypothetical protein
MKTSATIALATMLSGNAWAATKLDSQTVLVCIDDRGYTAVADAAPRASMLFRSAGVKLKWHSDVSFCRGKRDAIVFSLSTNTPKNFLPGALAYALPYEGVHIEVFYDRIALDDPDLVPFLMAHVMVHEIAHILEGTDQHSTHGIMKAHWNSYDYVLMKTGRLTFTEPDIEVIHIRSLARAARISTGTLVTAVAQ